MVKLSNRKIPVSIYFEFDTSVCCIHLREPRRSLHDGNAYYMWYTPQYKSIVLYTFIHIFIHVRVFYIFYRVLLKISCMVHRTYFVPRIIFLLSSAAPSTRPDLSMQGDTRILFYMHICVNIHMHDLMYTCDVQMNQRVELIFNHGTIFPIAAHERCSLVTWSHITWHIASLISPSFLTCVIYMS